MLSLPLLRFGDARLESDFWQWLPVRNFLLAVDQVAMAMILVNGISVLLLIRSLVQDYSAPQSFLVIFAAIWTTLAALQAASLWFLRAHRERYYALRSAILGVQRAVRVVFTATLTLHLTGPVGDAHVAAFLDRSAHQPAFSRIVKLLMARGFIGHGLMFSFQFPVRFSHALQNLLILPFLFHAAWSIVPALRRPDLAPTVCRMASYFFSLGSSGVLFNDAPAPECHPLSAEMLAYSAAAVFGGMTPLFIVYVIEAKAKLAFAKKCGLLQRAQADGLPLLRGVLVHSAHDMVNVLLLYLILLLLTCIATRSAVLYAHGIAI